MDMVIVTIREEHGFIGCSLNAEQQFVNRELKLKLGWFSVRKNESSKDGQYVYKNSKLHFPAHHEKQNKHHEKDTERPSQKERFILPTLENQK